MSSPRAPHGPTTILLTREAAYHARMDDKTLRARAEQVLRENDRGGFTVPSARLYPHQWNWDSAFCAIGWSHVDPKRAGQELEMLLRGLWKRGLLPHILFNPSATNYEPGPAVWETEGADGAPESVLTSSITQPPVAAIALRILLDRAPQDLRSLGVDLALKLARWHAWFESERCS